MKIKENKCENLRFCNMDHFFKDTKMMLGIGKFLKCVVSTSYTESDIII